MEELSRNGKKMNKELLISWIKREWAIKNNGVIFGITLFLTMLISLMITIMLEHSFIRSMSINYVSFLKNWVLVFSINMFVAACISNAGVAISICSTFFWLLSLINYYVSKYHGEPFLPQDIMDISTAKNVMETYSLSVNRTVIKIFLVYIVVMLGAVVFYQLKDKFNLKKRIIVILISLALFNSSIFVFASTEGVGTWNWEYACNINGYLYEFTRATIETINGDFIYKPEGYSDEKVSEYNNKNNHQIKEQEETNAEYPDIILILNETWYNLANIVDLDKNVNEMEYFSTLPCASKGYAIVPSVGGGTNRSEYELLTSNSLSLMKNGIIPYSWLNMKETPSIVSFLEQAGYSTLVAHPADPSNYRRERAYKDMGFDQIYFENDFESKGTGYGNRPHLLDSAAFRDFEKMMDDMPDNMPRFGFLLTLQNHGDYNLNSEEYDLVKVNSDYGELNDKLNEYLTSLKMTDDAIKELIDFYSKSDRKTIILMVGDHAPSFIGEIVGGVNTSVEIKEKSTPYFIWSNYLDNDVVDDENVVDMCNLVPMVLKYGGISLSPYYETCLGMAEKNIINSMSSTNNYYTTDGIEHGATDSTVKELLKSYYYLEYSNIEK